MPLNILRCRAHGAFPVEYCDGGPRLIQAIASAEPLIATMLSPIWREVNIPNSGVSWPPHGTRISPPVSDMGPISGLSGLFGWSFVCFRQVCATRVVLPSKTISDSRTMSLNAACTLKGGNPCHLRRHSRTHGRRFHGLASAWIPGRVR